MVGKRVALMVVKTVEWRVGYLVALLVALLVVWKVEKMVE